MLRQTLKQPTHFLVRFVSDGLYQVRSRNFIKSDQKITTGSTYEVQWGRRNEVDEAIVIAEGDYKTMKERLVEEMNVHPVHLSPVTPSTNDFPSPRSPTPPSPTIAAPTPAVRQQAKRRKLFQVEKPQAVVIGRGTPATDVLTPAAEGNTVMQGGQLSPAAQGNTATPVAQAGQSSPVNHGNTATPVADDRQSSPAAEGNTATAIDISTPANQGNTATPVTEEGQTSPVTHGNTATPVADDRQSFPAAEGNTATAVDMSTPADQDNSVNEDHTGTPQNASLNITGTVVGKRDRLIIELLKKMNTKIDIISRRLYNVESTLEEMKKTSDRATASRHVIRNSQEDPRV